MENEKAAPDWRDDKSAAHIAACEAAARLEPVRVRTPEPAASSGADKPDGEQADEGERMHGLLRAFVGGALGRMAVGGASKFDQLGPDRPPCLLTQHLPREDSIGGDFGGASLSRVHVPPPGQALVQVLLIDTGKLGKLPPLFGGKLL